MTAITLSLADAEAAFKQMVTQFGPYLPGDVYKLVKDRPIDQIYEICDAARYKGLFDITWNRTFKKANLAIFGDVDIPASRVPAFTTDVADITLRRVYLQVGAINSWGTYYHEAIHYLQHRDMYPIYYAVGGDAPFKMEGLTEYCTRYGSSKVAKERERNNSYQKNFQRTQSYIGGDLTREGDLFQVNFQGTGLGGTENSARIANLLHGIVP